MGLCALSQKHIYLNCFLKLSMFYLRVFYSNRSQTFWKSHLAQYKSRRLESSRTHFQFAVRTINMVTVKVCVLLVFVSSSFAYARSEIDARIFRGVNATKGQFPYFAQIVTNATEANATLPDYIYCGGSIISSKFVLTAAHCVEDFNLVMVTLGIYDVDDKSTQQYNYAERTFVHKGFNLVTGTNDIAIVQLANEIEFNEYIQPIPLSCEIISSGVWTQLVGRGQTHSGPTEFPRFLQWANLFTIPNEICATAYPRVDISSAKVCTFGKQKQGTCIGDSGSILLRSFNGTEAQIGVVNGGSSRGCKEGQISIFSRVSHYIDWIEKISGVKCLKTYS